MSNWENKEYKEINNAIDLVTHRIDIISKQIDENISKGEPVYSLEEKYFILCDERMRLIQQRHKIASKYDVIY